ncbi:MAG TPA: Gfo/Idh/MocA family oxidoreductase [Ignavibacteria bacterium]|nr:Gfo/Idh/MocA family oxidoreductase [Ignavibacteria bacterium]
MSDNLKKILLVGTGKMSRIYAKVLRDNHDLLVVGRGEKKTNEFKALFADAEVLAGGLTSEIIKKFSPDTAVIATSADQLFAMTSLLLENGVKNILVEKPSALFAKDIKKLNELAKENNAEVFLSYNRRHYASVLKAQEIIEEDGGILSVNFEFTEWINKIDTAKFVPLVYEKLVLSYSSHILDLVFYLIGKPAELNSDIKGKNVIPYHKSGAIFTGSGISDKNIPFTYHTNFLAPGRWAVEVLTKKHRLYFKPVEKLSVQKMDSLEIQEVPIEDYLEKEYSHGIYRMVDDFLNTQNSRLCTLDYHADMFKHYTKIAGYDD